MGFLKRIYHWLYMQLTTHTVRSVIIAISILVIAAGGILWAGGVFSGNRFTYLPDREYIPAPADKPEPQTLGELLHSDLPSIDTLLKNPDIAQELMQAEKLTDIVDSRLALNNLRSLDEQLKERLEEEAPAVVDISTSAARKGNVAGNARRYNAVGTAAQTYDTAAVEQTGDTAESSSTSASKLSISTDKTETITDRPENKKDQPGDISERNGSDVQQLAGSAQIAAEHREKLEAVKFAIEDLLTPMTPGSPVRYQSNLNIKGVWQSPDEALIHMVPSGGWLPEDGCKLYRVVNGRKELIGERFASSAAGLSGALKVENSDMIQQLYMQAELTPDKLRMLGMNAEEFGGMAYRTYSAESIPRIDGEIDFIAMKEALIAIPADIRQKIPETDLILGLPIIVSGRQSNEQYTNATMRSSVWKKFSVHQAEMPSGIDDLKLLPDGAKKFELASEILAARQRLSTLAFVDDDFAEEAGFLIRDDLSELDLPIGAEISYVAEMPAHTDSTIYITKGVENNLTKPQRLMGYGIDGKVPLRWAEAETKQERSILSGYHIERRLDGESNFSRITGEPVVITHMLDETNTYFQSPVFYEDTVENGRTAEYRIYSIDIFGRRSEYSDVIKLKVEKITPPNAPAAGTPGLTHSGKRGKSSIAGNTDDHENQQVSSAVEIAGTLNPNKRGIVLPVFTDSPDTVRFTIYRAVSVGARGFGPPEVIADLEYDNPKASALSEEQTESFEAGQPGLGLEPMQQGMPEASPVSGLEQAWPELYQTAVTRKGIFDRTKHALLKTPSALSPDLIYFDTDVQDGCTYKYWVSAWDSWNNESAWSQSVSMALPTDTEPQDPDELFIAMHPRILNDYSVNPPGLMHDGIVTYDDLALEADLPKRPAPEGAVMETVQNAIEDGVTIGSFLTSSGTRSYGSSTNAGVSGSGNNAGSSGPGITMGTSGQTISIDSSGAGIDSSSHGFSMDSSGPGIITGASRQKIAYCPPYIDIRYDNLPQDRYFHAFLGVRGEDVFPDGTARLKWPAYSGEGLGGYVVYRPLFDIKPLEEMQKMTRAELLRMGMWERMNESALTQNQLLVSGMDSTPGSLAVFLICLEPEAPEASESESSRLKYGDHLHYTGRPFPDAPSSENKPEGGYVYIDWDAPDDPQIEFYRVYRCEVPSFKEPIDESALEWKLVGDRLVNPKYTERVEQTYAHYYYYKVTSVSPWGVESTVGRIQRFRVPSTKPPQTPNLLIPLQTKDGVKVQFSAVSHCSRYEIYRAVIPRPGQEDIEELLASNHDLHTALFTSPTEEDVFLTNLLRTSLSLNFPKNTDPYGSRAPQAAGQSEAEVGSSAAEAGSNVQPQNASESYLPVQINPISKLKTLTFFNTASVLNNLTGLSDDKLRLACRTILDKYGPLALADYKDLSIGMMKRVKWVKIGELPADYDTNEAVDPATGLLKPLSFTDTTARYGITYLYTVQAWNDDNLGSSRPEPVEATPRRNRAFDPIDGLTGGIDGTMKPSLRWNLPKMFPLTQDQCLEDTVGYIVYRSDTRDGTYYQASPLLFSNSWVDEAADPFAFNWYRVKVLDTGGYLSEFSEPVLVRLNNFVTGMTTEIPGLLGLETSEISIDDNGLDIGKKDETPTEIHQNPIDTPQTPIDTPKTPADTSQIPIDMPQTPIDTPQTPIDTPQTPIDTPQVMLIAPRISFDGNSFRITQGEEFGTVYELTGTEPITVAVKAATADGSAVGGFSADQAARLVKAGPDLEIGTYHVTATAKNAAGEHSASFTLTVQAKPAIPPKLAVRDDDYNFTILAGSDTYTIQLSATGTEPLRWSLTSGYSRFSTLPSEISIDNNGLLTISKGIKSGKYSFIVKVTNDAGSDEKAVNITVMTRFSPIGLNIPKLLSTVSGAAGTNTIPLSNLAAQSNIPAYKQIPVQLYALSGTPAFENASDQPGTQIQGLQDNNIQGHPGTQQVSAASGQHLYPHTQSPTIAYDVEIDQMKCMGFTLTDVKLNRGQFSDSFAGKALLNIGYDTPIDVWIINADIEDAAGYADSIMKKGAIYISAPVRLENIGLTLISLNISPDSKTATVSGYIKSTIEDQNLAGDLFALEFEDAALEPGRIDVSDGIPEIRYKQFIIKNLGRISIHLDAAQSTDKELLSMSGREVYMRSHLETLSNEGLQFEQSIIRFDMQGKMDATFVTTRDQCLQLLVPGGAGLRVNEAALQFMNGEVRPGGRLRGKLVLPFEKASTGGELVPAVYAGKHPAHSEMDDLASGNGGLTDKEKAAVGDMLVHYGETVQQNSLLILPDSFTLQDKCTSVPIDINNWTGEGFIAESSTMDPVRVTNRNVDEGHFIDHGHYDYKQRNQAVIVTPMTVSVDLDRKGSLSDTDSSQSQSGTGEILTPKEVGEPFWVGIVINGGKLALPSSYLQQADGGTIEFELAEGEMIYDLNGFSYQTYMYGSDPEGVPARFGDSLGGFENVRIKDCLLDMYANRVNFEINARVRVDLFQNEWIEAKLFTDEKGSFICSAAPTMIRDGLAKGVDVKINGGFFEQEGLKISGQLILPPPGTAGYELGSPDPLAFTNMIVPSDLEKIRVQSDTNIYASVPLDKPVNINFQGFPMEVRGFDIKYTGKKKTEVLPRDRTDFAELTLRGATQLSDTIALSEDTTDSLVVKCVKKEDIPTVLYDKSYSVLKNSFEGCIDVIGRLVPKKMQNVNSGPIEFESEELELIFLGQNLNSMPVTHYTRFGKAGSSFYFAVGLTPMNGKPINFGAGNIEKFTGLVVQNMKVDKDEQGRLAFPANAGGMSAYIRDLQVGGGKFTGGIKGEMTVFRLCTIKDLYFGFEPGPKVTAGGDVYLPLDIKSIVDGNPSRHVGRAVIQYRHPDRYFSFKMTFDSMNIVIFDFGGSLGLEYSPRLFGVQIGYPETLYTNFQLGPIPVHVGAGLGFRIDQDNESMVQAKLEFGLEKEIKVAIVYLHGYIYAGADGAYYWGGPDGSRITLDIYLKGGINGGIEAFDKRYDIISFYLDAHGTLASGGDFKSWEIGCSCTVGYSLDLWLVEIEGSVNASFDTRIALPVG